MNTKIVKLDINRNLYDTLTAKQGDTQSRFLLFQLLDGAIPFSLENRSVKVFATKPDGKEVFNDLIINDRVKGYCTLELTNQMLAVPGLLKLELMVIEGDKKLTTNVFYMDVKKSINSENAIVSTNEFSALLNGLASLNEYDNYKNEIAAARDGEVNLLTKVKKIDEQLDNIVHLIDNPNFELIGDGEYKLINDIVLNSTLIIPSNTKIKSFGKIITANFDGVIIDAQGKNITIDGLKINCNNHACTGILVNTNSEKVNILNNEVYNSYGGTTKASYGIFVSAIGCNDINIKNNYVHDIISNDDGVIAQRDGGWAKGILVDLYDVISERPNDESIISTNITIENNTVINIQDYSDADGIYIEGYKCENQNNVKIINNYLKNCGKRFIKVLNVGNIDINGNYGINENTELMHSFISLYTGNATIKNNKMLTGNLSKTRYGVEIGYQSKYGDIYVDDIIIEDNNFDIGINIDYGNVIARPEYDGKINNIKIKNNILKGGSENIKFVNGTEIKSIEITDNILKNNIAERSSITISNLSVDKILIQRNKAESDNYSNSIVINNLKKGEYIIKDNFIGECKYACIKINNGSIGIIENNIMKTTTLGYSIENVDNSKTNNNFDLRTNSNIETKTELPKFIYKSIVDNAFDVDITECSDVVTIKLMSTVSTTLNSLIGNSGQIINICSGNSTSVLINHDNSIHLKNNTSYTFNNMEQCITLVKLDNRWLEISRNF